MLQCVIPHCEHGQAKYVFFGLSLCHNHYVYAFNRVLYEKKADTLTTAVLFIWMTNYEAERHEYRNRQR